MSKKVWIIGGSSGIGFELVKQYLKNADKVIVSARSATNSKSLAELHSQYTKNLTLLDMDVTQTQNVLDVTKKAWEVYEGVDLCFYNAGAYESMKMDEWKLEHFEAMNQINYLGAIRILTSVAPLFQAQKSGHFVFNISISSYFGLPYGGGYSAPKAALLNFCESIQPELILKNIKVQVINHGFVKTRLTAKNDFEMPQLLEPSEAANKIWEPLKTTSKVT